MARKDDIIAGAKELFKEKGYVGASMRDLAQKIGIEASSLYNHVKSKEELLQLICFDLADQYMGNLETLKKRKYGYASAWLKDAMAMHLEVTANNLEASVIFLNEWRFLSEEAMAEYREFRKNYENQFRDCIKKGVQNGEFRRMNEKLATISILSNLNWTANWYKPEGKDDIQTVSEQLFDMILNGLKQ